MRSSTRPVRNKLFFYEVCTQVTVIFVVLILYIANCCFNIGDLSHLIAPITFNAVSES